MVLDHTGQDRRRPTPRRPLARTVAAAALTALLAPSILISQAAPAVATPPTCAPPTTGGPILITADCIDPSYTTPVIDSEIDLTTPVATRKVSGHFDGTTAKFTIYLPPKDQWQGRFHQSLYPLQGELAIDDPDRDPTRVAGGSIASDTASGAYTVQTNGSSGYRVDAAAAKFAKTVAAGYYHTDRRIYGYAWGGSGGSFMTIGALENTEGVWDGGVPFIIGSPTAIPNNFFVRAFARFVLGDKANQIAAAVAPGGSGNPYAGLNPTEKSVLREVSTLGVPLRGWEQKAEQSGRFGGRGK